MNLENYTQKTMVAVKNNETGKFSFVCEATEEGKTACNVMANNFNVFSGRKEFSVTFFTAYIKTPKIKW